MFIDLFYFSYFVVDPPILQFFPPLYYIFYISFKILFFSAFVYFKGVRRLISSNFTISVIILVVIFDRCHDQLIWNFYII